jgi:iron complex transport system ATP-binding protein
MSARLQIDDLHVRRGGRPVLCGLELGVRSGELVALIGANGCGKTTLLEAVARRLPLQRGTITLDGRPVEAFTPRGWARRVAVVPQVYELPAGFTVAQLVAFGRHPHLGLWRAPAARDEVAARRALASLGLEDRACRPLQQLSGGERQLVVLAMAFAQEPELLLLDEPTAHLDLRHEAGIMAAVRGACDRAGVSALAVLHDLRLVRRYCDRAALLDHGRIVADGPPREVLLPAVLSACFGVEEGFFADNEREGGPVVAAPVPGP